MTTTSITTVLADSEARTAALHPTRSFIVQAPAGSGKTELLTQRYLRLLTTVDQPEQILAITFTRKAASEMRQRILQSLHRARITARPDKAHEAQNWDLAHQALQHDAKRGWCIETHPARLRIQTIDSLNSSLSRRFPVLAGMGASMDIAQDVWPLYETVCERLLQQLGDHNHIAQHLQVVLRHLANRVPDFITMLGDLLARRDHWLPLLMQHRGDADLRDSIEHTLQCVIAHHLQQVRLLLPADSHAELVALANFAATNMLKDDPDHAGMQQLAHLEHIPAASVDELPQWLAIAGFLCKKDGSALKPELYLSVNKNQGFPTGKEHKPSKDRMLQLLADLALIPGLAQQLADIASLPSATFNDAQWRMLAALLQLLPHAAGELKLEFQARGQVDYVELALRALQAMGSEEQPTDTALAMDARLQHILIDEFQDTSVTQMQLLKLLTAGWSDGEGRTVFCVGDPMQSIYRFRQAEVGLFLSVQQQGLPAVAVTPLALQTNFRSTQPIVAWVNHSFPHIMPAHDYPELGAVHYSASLPRPDAATLGGVTVHAAIERTATQEAEQITQLVHARLQASSTDRIAILVSGRSHVSAIAQSLKRANIGFKAVDIERLQDRPLVQDLMSLTRALLHLGDRTAWLACLRAPWCGLTLTDLHALVGNHAEQTVWACLQSVATDWRGSLDGLQRIQQFTRIMSAALQQRARHALHDWVERTWLALKGPACVSTANELEDAQSYFARLDELEVAGELEDLGRLEEQLSTLFASASNDGTEVRVEIMTIHKSKGLEFEVVILPSLHRIGGRDQTRLLRWAHLSGLPADGLVLAVPARKGDAGDATYQWLADLEQRRARFESQRLLYVAVTRAKRELHLFGSAKPNKAGDKPNTPTAGTLLSLLWPLVEGEFLSALNSQTITQPQQWNDSVPSASLKRLPLQWQPTATVAAITGMASNALVNADQAIEFDWVGEAARHIGTVVHAELERLVKLPRAAVLSWRGNERQHALTLRLAELGVPEALRATACERVIRAIEHTLQDARGRWILGLETPHREAGSEIALTGVIHQQVIHGVIDRSVVDAEGTRWIIDFKTSNHEGSGLEQFLDSEVERYRGQMERYRLLMQAWRPAEPVRCALYFPLLGQWREVTPHAA